MGEGLCFWCSLVNFSSSLDTLTLFPPLFGKDSYIVFMEMEVTLISSTSSIVQCWLLLVLGFSFIVKC